MQGPPGSLAVTEAKAGSLTLKTLFFSEISSGNCTQNNLETPAG